MVDPADRAGPEARVRLEAALRDAERPLMAQARRMCGNPDDARDLVQDAFERATRHGLPDDIRNTRAWLARLMHNAFVDRCRASARKPIHEQLDDDRTDVTQMEPDAPEPPWADLSDDDVRRALADIDAAFGDVYALHCFQHLSYQDIATKLGIQPVTVGTRLTRARTKLREVLVKRFGLEKPR
jgi:RNA polymerase sigma-70 factor (ECF subfamily)